MTEVWIDMGGTFTDCILRDAAGTLRTHKLLSSASYQTTLEALDGGWQLDPRFANFPLGFLTGAKLHHIASQRTITVTGHPEPRTIIAPTGTILKDWEGDCRFEFSLDAPVIGTRWLLRKGATEPIGPVDVRIGTTKGTNALLERQGASTALMTTRGFGDAFAIGYQDRPRLFDLRIQRPQPIYRRSFEVDERVDANGKVFRDIDLDQVKQALQTAKKQGIESLAICLLNSHRNSVHEERIEQAAIEMGFRYVSRSSRIANLQKMIPRGDTALIDAYLSPIIDLYTQRIREAMPEANLRWMTSSGGLTSTDQFEGHQSILSGPAGGVVGVAATAKSTGIDRMIGLDMGGTSTDVCRFDGSFQRRFEWSVEDPDTGDSMRLFSPMLAIETVAAGGGSVCWYDGTRLRVGPQSAGAEPGPACYGCGGPLTITDINLYLGHLPASEFAFPLSVAPVTKRLKEVAALVDPSGSSRSLERIAADFFAVANEKMANAITRLAIEQGFDPCDHALVAFGGAACQHAAGIADLLGIGHVIQHPLGPMLSAYGIGIAPTSKFAQIDVGKPLSDVAEELTSMFRKLEEEARSRLDDDLATTADSRRESATTIQQADLRYAGQDSVVTVTMGEGPSIAEKFAQEHRRIFGFAHEDREIEVRSLRVEVQSQRPIDHLNLPRHSFTTTLKSTSLFSGEAWKQIPTLTREQLQGEGRIEGPALLLERSTSAYIPVHWSAQLDDKNLIHWHRASVKEANNETAAAAVPRRSQELQRAILGYRFYGIAEQMGATLVRTALSVNIKERRDFSCAIFDRKGGLIANAPHIPVHLGAMGETVRNLLRTCSSIREGDGFVTNDPYLGGSHLPDVTVIHPVFASGDIAFFVANRAHHAEIGGTTPGSMPAQSQTLGEEGIILQHVRYIHRGASETSGLLEKLSSGPYPSRQPRDNLADIDAQVAANRWGVQALEEWIESEGVRSLQGGARDLMNASEEATRRRLHQFDRGTFTFADKMDQGSRIAVRISIPENNADPTVFDFRDSDDQDSGNLNATPSIVRSAVLYCLRCLTEGDAPLNEGYLRPIDILLREGSLLSPLHGDDPSIRPAVVGGNVETSQRLVDVILGALGVAAASQGTMNNVIIGSSGRGGTPPFGYYETLGGGVGAGPNYDGADGIHSHMTNTRITDPEVLEERYPLRLVAFSIRKGSGGLGIHHGGDGLIREFECLAPLEVSLLTSRRTTDPFGLEGGGAGRRGRNLLRRRGESDYQELPSLAQISINPGDRLRIETPGGGGFGRRDASPARQNAD